MAKFNSPTEQQRREIMLAIKTRAKALGLSDQAIGEKVGLRANSVNRMLSGKFSTKLDHVIALARAVGVEISIRDAFLTHTHPILTKLDLSKHAKLQ